ncbi:MAG: hypothetical protein DRP55_06925 [Spirochaetes bacterium]|nr:MAG: hypothetical protein DRP55_06925 [Spirochaetota bacterium]
MMKIKILIPLIFSLIVLFFACSNSPPVIRSLTADPSTVELGEISKISVSAIIYRGDHVTFRWSATGGTIIGDSYEITWVAPEKEGTYTITCIVDDGTGAQDISSVDVDVIAKTWQTVTTLDGIASNKILSVESTSKGEYIAGTDFGVSLYIDETWRNENKDTTLPDNNVIALFVDEDDVIWIGTQEGLVEYNKGEEKWTTITTNDGMPSNRVQAIVLDNDKNLWVGTDQGLGYRDSSKDWHIYTVDDGLPSNNITSVDVDSDNNIWVGTDKGIAKYDREVFTIYDESNGLFDDNIYTLSVDSSNNVWAGSDALVTMIGSNEEFSYYTPDEGVPDFPVVASDIDILGRPWFATYGGGAFRIKDEVVEVKNSTDGLVSDFVNDVKFDKKSGNLLFGTDEGLSIY